MNHPIPAPFYFHFEHFFFILLFN